MISKDDWSRAVDFTRKGTLFAHSEYHGENHWRAVASQGISVAKICNLGAQGLAVGALFGLFHDCRRVNDEWDPEHGHRAALAFLEWAGTVTIPISMLKQMMESLKLHDNGQTTENKIIGIGWDADRSTLGRVGITPDFTFFSCIPEAKFNSYIESGEVVSQTPPDWDEIYARAFL
jgi:uncharacterized protein